MRATGRGMSKTPTNTTLEPLYYTPLMGPHMCMEKWGQMTQSKKLSFTLLIFARLIY